MRAIAAEDQVGVAVDQAGRNPALVALDSLLGIPIGWQVAHWANEGDTAASGGHAPILHDTEISIATGQRRDASIHPYPVEAHLVLQLQRLMSIHNRRAKVV